MRLLHIITRFVGGGPERAILALAERDRRLGRAWAHTVAVLEAPVSPRLFMHAKRLGVGLAIRPAADALLRAAEAADLIQIHYWNHPGLTSLLRSIDLPPARILLWARILGTRAPQVLFGELGRYADRLILTSELSRASEAASAAMERGRPVDVVPSVLDTSRLDGFAARPHMKFIVSSTVLLKQLQLLQGVLASSNTLPILDNFLFDIDGKQLTVAASDLETTITASLAVEAKDKGTVAIPARLLLDTLKAFPEQPLTFSVDSKHFGVVDQQ